LEITETMKYPNLDISLEQGIHCPFCGIKTFRDDDGVYTCNHVLFIVSADRFTYVNEDSSYDQDPDLCGATIDEFIDFIDEINMLKIEFRDSSLQMGDGFIIFQKGE